MIKYRERIEERIDRYRTLMDAHKRDAEISPRKETSPFFFRKRERKIERERERERGRERDR